MLHESFTRAGDLNNDGWPDLCVANDFGPDELFFNTGATEAPAAFHLVVDPAGHPGIGNNWWEGMNVEMGDVDGNGRLDLFSVNGFITGSDPDNTYWFQLQEMVTQVNYNSADARDWPELEDRDLSGYEPNRLFLQLPPTDEGSPPRFIETAAASGITDLLNGRGVSVLDYDDDGDAEAAVEADLDPMLEPWYAAARDASLTPCSVEDTADWVFHRLPVHPRATAEQPMGLAT